MGHLGRRHLACCTPTPSSALNRKTLSPPLLRMSKDQIENAILLSCQGNETGYESLFEAFSGVVFRLIYGMGITSSEAEELTQDVFLQAFRAIKTYDARRARFSTWLLRIAHNLTLNHLRISRAQLVHLEESEMDNITTTEEEETFLEEETEALQHAITRLRGEERELLQMFYYENLSLKEIAYVTDSNAQALANRLSRIRKKLRRIIETERDKNN